MNIGLAELLSWHALAVFLLVNSMLGMVLGLLLIVRSRHLLRINRLANHWISTQAVSQWLDRSVSIERWFYRNHRAMGLLIVLGALYILLYFCCLFDQAYALRHLSLYLPEKLIEALLEALVILLQLGAGVALIAGLLIFWRPSLLRGIEKKANRWVSLPRVSELLDKSYHPVDPFVAQHARSMGWMLLLASIYLFFTMFRFLT